MYLPASGPAHCTLNPQLKPVPNHQTGAVSGRSLVYAGLVLVAACQVQAETVTRGIVNSFQGEASINGVPVSGPARVQSGQTFKTGRGMAELLLTAGTFLRLGHDSTLSFASSGGAEVEVRLSKGEALVEAVVVHSPDFPIVREGDTTTVIMAPGLYEFNQRRGAVAAYAGSAKIIKGAKQVALEAGFGYRTRNLHEVTSVSDPGNALYAWSNFRSEQLSLESAASAQTYSGSLDEWHSPSWYWDPWSSSYTLLSASGHVNSPFGWPFYAPGHSHNYLPQHRGGDSFLYGPPVPIRGGVTPAGAVAPGMSPVPTVPLTAPGVPAFPNSHSSPPAGPHFGRP